MYGKKTAASSCSVFREHAGCFCKPTHHSYSQPTIRPPTQLQGLCCEPSSAATFWLWSLRGARAPSASREWCMAIYTPYLHCSYHPHPHPHPHKKPNLTSAVGAMGRMYVRTLLISSMLIWESSAIKAEGRTSREMPVRWGRAYRQWREKGSNQRCPYYDRPLGILSLPSCTLRLIFYTIIEPRDFIFI